MIDIILNNLEYILSIISVIICFILSLIINIKKIKKLKSENKEINNIEFINSVLEEYIKKAEEFKNFTGIEKKEYVLTKTNKYLFDNNIHISDDVIDKKIEELIDLTNLVNTNKTKNYISKLNGDNNG